MVSLTTSYRGNTYSIVKTALLLTRHFLLSDHKATNGLLKTNGLKDLSKIPFMAK